MSVAAVLRQSAIDLGPTVALHALNRLGFGPRPADVRRVLARGLDQARFEIREPHRTIAFRWSRP